VLFIGLASQSIGSASLCLRQEVFVSRLEHLGLHVGVAVDVRARHGSIARKVVGSVHECLEGLLVIVELLRWSTHRLPIEILELSLLSRLLSY